jgi:predicted phage terminase large subunit-like protein
MASPKPNSAAAKLLADRILARRRLLHFTKLTHPRYSAGWVHDDICRRLERFSREVAEGKSPRLMLLMPPRHGKSELASIRFPAWHLGQYPHHELINVGYNLDLPMGFSRKVREVFRDPQYQAIFPGAQLDPESQSVEKWNTTKGGGFTAAGRGGGITGKGAHILIVDDPIKDQEEADSALVREKLWDWYQSTAYTRLAPGGGVLVIQTWWNDDDLAGRLQQAMALIGKEGAPEGIDDFEIIKYPALSHQYEYRDDVDPNNPGPIIRTDEPIDLANPPLGMSRHLTMLRPKDFCLHEDRYPTEALKRIRANLQPRIWSALYQQNPVPDEGMYFRKEYFRYQRQLPSPSGLRIYTAWDFAIGEKQANDWTVGATILQDELDQLYVLEIFRMKGDSFQIVEAMLDVATRWGSMPGTGYLLGAEDGQIWRAVEPLFKKRMVERRQYLPYEVLRPMTDKMARARPLQGRMQQGRVIFPEEAAWRAQAEQELLRFPAGVHDDVVDALAWAVQLCMGKEPPQAYTPPPLKSWRDRLSESFAGSGSHMSA